MIFYILFLSFIENTPEIIVEKFKFVATPALSFRYKYQLVLACTDHNSILIHKYVAYTLRSVVSRQTMSVVSRGAKKNWGRGGGGALIIFSNFFSPFLIYFFLLSPKLMKYLPGRFKHFSNERSLIVIFNSSRLHYYSTKLGQIIFYFFPLPADIYHF